MECIKETSATLEDFLEDDPVELLPEFVDLLDIRQPIESKSVCGVLLSDAGIGRVCLHASLLGA